MTPRRIPNDLPVSQPSSFGGRATNAIGYLAVMESGNNTVIYTAPNNGVALHRITVEVLATISNVQYTISRSTGGTMGYASGNAGFRSIEFDGLVLNALEKITISQNGGTFLSVFGSIVVSEY